MRVIVVLWTFILCSLMWCSPVEAAAKIYVDATLNGDCANGRYNVALRSCNGSDGSGFGSFGSALVVMQPGDTMMIRGGTYRTPLVVTRSGVENAPLVFMAYPGEPVVIDMQGSHAANSGIDIGGQQYLEFRGISVQNAPMYGFRGYRNSFITIADSEFAFSSHAGVVFETGSHITVTRARIHHNNRGGNWHEAISFAEVDQFSITDSVVYENGKEGIDAKYGSRGGIIARNHVYRNNGPNIYLDAVSSILVADNICHDTLSNQKACVGLAIESTYNPRRFQTADINVFNNVMYGSGAGVFFWIEDAGVSWARFDNIRIEHNTIVDNTANNFGGVYFLNGTARNFGTGNTIRNNIIMGNGRRGIRDDRGVTQLFGIDHNLFQSGDNSATFGANAVVTSASPFVDRNGRNFRLTPASPARNAGRQIPDIRTDIEGRPRPATPDVGAYQFESF